MKPIQVVVSLFAALAVVIFAAAAVFAAAQAGSTGAPARQSTRFFAVEADPGPDWTALLQGSTLVVRAHVITTASNWDAGHTQIESDHTVAIRYTLRGSAPEQIVVHTVGGVLAGSGLSMVATGLPTLSTGEEVLLFLAPAADGYSVAGNDAGKYLVENSLAVNRPFLLAMPLGDLYTALKAADPSVAVPVDWVRQEAAVRPEPIIGGQDYVYNKLKWPVNRIEYKVNVNSTRTGNANGTVGDFLTAMTNAATTWSMVGDADFTFDYGGPSTSTEIGYNNANEVLFINKGITDVNGNPQPLAVARVYYIGEIIVETDIWINDAFAWDATGSPGGQEPDLESVVLHEFGHWLSLGHDSDATSVMVPQITLGTLKRVLGDNDRRGIVFIYPCASGQQPCNPLLTPTPTPNPPTPTFTPTPTATPTPMATSAPTAQPVSAEILPDLGGSLVFSATSALQIVMDAPQGAVAITTTLRVHHIEPEGEEGPAGEQEIECFAVTGDQGDGELTLLNFVIPVTLTLRYNETILAGSEEESLVLFAYDPQMFNWARAGCGSVERNLEDNQLTIHICHLSTFGVFRGKLPMLYLPLINN